MQINVGDTITVHEGVTYPRASGNSWPGSLAVLAATKLVVTRAYSGTVVARGPIHRGQDASIRVAYHRITTVNGIDPKTGQPPIVPRQLGVQPADTDTMTYIGIDHPGIQWLFEDMGKFAEQREYCEQYDELCDELGIPNRGEEYEVEIVLEGITVRADVRGLSWSDAQSKLAELLHRSAITGKLGI